MPLRWAGRGASDRQHVALLNPENSSRKFRAPGRKRRRIIRTVLQCFKKSADKNLRNSPQRAIVPLQNSIPQC
jgi:hypothetical protein